MKILVVDDEPLARERLVRLLAESRPEARCLQASSGMEALERVRVDNPELVLLDIRMPGMDGIEVAARFGELEYAPAVVFCTAYDEYALQALQYQAVAYLMKPVRAAELERALNAAGKVNRAQLASLEAAAGGEGGRASVSSQTHRGVETMPVADIRCFLAEQKYVTAVGPEGELMLSESLKDLEREFGNRFLRVHRNALVAMEHVVRLDRARDGWHVVLADVAARPAISRRHLSDVKQRLLDG